MVWAPAAATCLSFGFLNKLNIPVLIVVGQYDVPFLCGCHNDHPNQFLVGFHTSLGLLIGSRESRQKHSDPTEDSGTCSIPGAPNSPKVGPICIL